MGAFGELLIKSWGGDLRKYRGDDVVNDAPIEIRSDEEIEKDEKELKLYFHNKRMENELHGLFDQILYGYRNVDDIDPNDFRKDEHRDYFIEWKKNIKNK